MEARSNMTSDTFGVTSEGQWRTVQCRNIWYQGTGYGTSSSSVRILFILVPLFCASMFDDMSLGRTLPPWQALLFDITPHSIQPSYLRPSSLPYISIVIHPAQCSSLLTICPYQFRILYWTSIAISPTFGASIPYSSIPYHVDHCDFAYPS